MECPVCFNVPFPPIFLCENGHNICKFCKVKLTECPTCKGKFSDIRNRAIEDMVLASRHDCPHSKEGCKIQEVGSSIENHVTTCGYRPITCPKKGVHGCDRSVLHLSEAADHFLNVHKADLFSGPSHKVKVIMSLANIEDAQKSPPASMGWPLTLIKFDGNYFLSEIFSRQGMICWIVSHIGEENDAKRYRVQIVCHPCRNVEMQWSVPVYSIHKSSLQYKTSAEIIGNSAFTPSCRIQDFIQTLEDKDGADYTFSTRYLLSKVEKDTANGK